MSTRPRVPDWIRQFSYPGWTNVFQLVSTNDHLYGTETLFGDWNSRVLLLAKDGCPTHVIRERVDREESRPWRHGRRELGDKVGPRTNERLCRFVSLIPETKLLYGSAAAHMLYDDSRTSRPLAGFDSGPLHDFLKRVLSWVLESMPRVEWVACLGEDAWFLTCMTIGNPSAARKFKGTPRLLEAGRRRRWEEEGLGVSAASFVAGKQRRWGEGVASVRGFAIGSKRPSRG